MGDYNKHSFVLKNNLSNTAQAFWVAMGSFASFGFAIVSSMILSRYFPKEDYGTYKQVMYVYSTLLTVFTLGLPKAYGYFLPRVPLSQGKSVVNKLTNLFFILGACFSFGLFVFAPFIADILKNEQLEVAIRIFAPVPFLMLPTMGLESIYATYRKTFVSAIYTVITRILMLVCVALPVVIWNGNYKMALWGFLISSFVSFLIALYLKNSPFKGVEHKKCNITYRKIFSFSLPLMYASIWGIIITSADQFFISRYFGTTVFADFSNGSIELPFVGMVIGACSTVLFPLFSKMNNENLDPINSILPIWHSVFKKTAMITYPLIVFCFFFAETIMTILYGDRYSSSAGYFQFKVIVNLFTLISYAPVLLALGKTKYYANVHAVSAIILVIMEFLSATFIDDPHAIVIISVACQLGRIFAMLALISKIFKTTVVHLFPLKLIGLIIIPSAIFLQLFKLVVNIDDTLFYFITALISYILFYTIWCCIIRLDYKSIIIPLLKR